MPQENLILDRIVINPEIMTGKPVIRGTRLTVQFILQLLAQGMSIQDIIQEYYNLTPEDIYACLLFASNTLEQSTFTSLSNKAV